MVMSMTTAAMGSWPALLQRLRLRCLQRWVAQCSVLRGVRMSMAMVMSM